MSKRTVHSKRVAFWFTLSVSVAVAGPLLAQEGTNAAIAVTVTGSDGSVVLPGVTVTAINAQTGNTVRMITDTYGMGFLHDVAPGNWLLTFEREGSGTLTHELHVNAGEANSATVDLSTSDLLALREAVESRGSTSDAKHRKIIQYLEGEIDLEALNTHVDSQADIPNGDAPELKFEQIMQYLSGEIDLKKN